MEAGDFHNAVSHLRFDFYGCEYKGLFDGAVKKAFSKYGLSPVTRGVIGPAAGVGLSFDVVMTIAVGVASGLIVEAVKEIFEVIKGVASENLLSDCHPGRVTIETERFDIIIASNNSAGMRIDWINYDNLIHQMKELAASEFASGRDLVSIATPCDINPSSDSFVVRNTGVGNYSLWLIAYREARRWPFCLYDAVNDVFIPVNDKQLIASVIDGADSFYSAE